jgi:H+/Cl- antiporter ClcA
MIIYLEDPRIWLSLTLGLVLVAAGGTLARWVLRYSYRHKGHPQVQALKLAFVGILYGSAFLCIRGIQWRYGSGSRLYTEAFAFGLLGGLPLAFLLALRGNSRSRFS